MKRVLILFGNLNWHADSPFENKHNQESYETFYSLGKKNAIEMFRASYDWYDLEKKIFKYAWTFDEASGWRRVENIRPDLIYDKTSLSRRKKELISKNYQFVNNLRFTQIINDKLITGLIFHKWSKKSWIVNDQKKLKRILPNIKSQKFVVKPIADSGGKNVQIIDKENAFDKIIFGHDYLVQEFIDSSQGVPGVTREMHDLRLVFINDKLSYSYIREPAEGNYLANLSQGGTLSIVPKNKIPQTLDPIIRYANKVFEIFDPRIYSIDFMFDENERPWIVEMNSMPGLNYTAQEKPYMIEMYKELIQVFRNKIDA